MSATLRLVGNCLWLHFQQLVPTLWFELYVTVDQLCGVKMQLQGVAPDQQSTSSSTDVSQSVSSTTSLNDDNHGNCINNASYHESGQLSLFHAVVRMIAMVEGGILDPNDPEFGFAVNDALYGILINKTHRLVYTRQFGLRLVDFIE